MKLRIEIPSGYEIPKGYGVAYYKTGFDLAVCYPVPFNLVACWLRLLWWHIRVPPGRFAPRGIRRALRRAYVEGYGDANDRLKRLGEYMWNDVAVERAFQRGHLAGWNERGEWESKVDAAHLASLSQRVSAEG